jgi:branched-chain amino acid transport system substrate-binding protein
MKKRPIAALAAALTGLTVLAACSGSGASTGSGGGDSIHIGAILPTGTSAGNYPEALASIRAAARAVNASGGVNGHRLVVDYCNENANVNSAATCARKAAAGRDIALVSTVSTFAAQSILPNLRDLPNVGPYALAPKEIVCPTCYAFDAELFGGFGATGSLAKQAHVPSARVVTLDIPVARSTSGQTNAAIRKKGIAVQPPIYIPPTASDYAPYAQKFLESGAKAVVPLLPQQGVFGFLQAVKQAGGHPIVLANDSEIRLQDLPSLGSAVDGAKFVLTAPPATAAPKIKGVRTWLAELKKEAATGDKNARVQNSVSLHAWLATHAVAEIASGIKGKVDRASFAAALKKAHDVSLYGIFPAWTPSAKAPAGVAPGMTNPYVFFAEAKNNTFVLLKDKAWNLAANRYVDLPAS